MFASPASGKSIVLSISLVLILGSFAVAQAAQQATNYLMITAPEGSKSSNVKTLQAKITIDAPPSLVWQKMTDYAHLKDTMPGYQKSTILESNGNQKTLAIAMRVSPLLPVYKYQVLAKENRDALTLDFQRISGDFKMMHATYRLTPKSGGKQTDVVYNLAIDTGSNLPGTHAILKSNTEKTFRAMEANIEESYRKSMIGQR